METIKKFKSVPELLRIIKTLQSIIISGIVLRTEEPYFHKRKEI